MKDGDAVVDLHVPTYMYVLGRAVYNILEIYGGTSSTSPSPSDTVGE
jgi:hypothetical protein